MYRDKRPRREVRGGRNQNLCYIHADLGAWIHLHTNMGVESDFQDNLSHERNSELYSIYVIQAGSSFRKVLSFVKIE